MKKVPFTVVHGNNSTHATFECKTDCKCSEAILERRLYNWLHYSKVQHKCGSGSLFPQRGFVS